MTRYYNQRNLKKDLRFIEYEAKSHKLGAASECSPIEVRIRIPFNPHDNPDKVLKAVLEESYDLIRGKN